MGFFNDTLAFKLILATIGATVIELAGANWLGYEVLLILVLADFATGVGVAFRQKRLSSRKASATVLKIIKYFTAALVAHQLTRLAPELAWFEQGIVFYLAAIDVLSIFENLHKLDVPVPEAILDKLEIYAKKESPTEKK